MSASLADFSPTEILPQGWVYADISYNHRNGTTGRRIEIIETATENRFLNEPMNVIACKCGALFLLGLPAYFIGYTLFHLVRIPLALMYHRSVSLFCKAIWNVARAPFYFVGLEFAALYGVFHPLEGRSLFAQIEGALHCGKSRREDFRDQKIEQSDLDFLKNAFLESENEMTFFAGHCMQPLGNLRDLHIIRRQILLDSSQDA